MYNELQIYGLVAQLGAHHIRIVGVEGSNPFKSTIIQRTAEGVAFCGALFPYGNVTAAEMYDLLKNVKVLCGKSVSGCYTVSIMNPCDVEIQQIFQKILDYIYIYNRVVPPEQRGCLFSNMYAS